jgi:hypothetical protein
MLTWQVQCQRVVLQWHRSQQTCCALSSACLRSSWAHQHSLLLLLLLLLLLHALQQQQAHVTQIQTCQMLQQGLWQWLRHGQQQSS